MLLTNFIKNFIFFKTNILEKFNDYQLWSKYYKNDRKKILNYIGQLLCLYYLKKDDEFCLLKYSYNLGFDYGNKQSNLNNITAEKKNYILQNPLKSNKSIKKFNTKIIQEKRQICKKIKYCNIIKEKQNYTCIFNITKENDIPLLIHDINKNILQKIKTATQIERMQLFHYALLFLNFFIHDINDLNHYFNGINKIKNYFNESFDSDMIDINNYYISNDYYKLEEQDKGKKYLYIPNDKLDYNNKIFNTLLYNKTSFILLIQREIKISKDIEYPNCGEVCVLNFLRFLNFLHIFDSNKILKNDIFLFINKPYHELSIQENINQWGRYCSNIKNVKYNINNKYEIMGGSDNMLLVLKHFFNDEIDDWNFLNTIIDEIEINTISLILNYGKIIFTYLKYKLIFIFEEAHFQIKIETTQPSISYMFNEDDSLYKNWCLLSLNNLYKYKYKDNKFHLTLYNDAIFHEKIKYNEFEKFDVIIDEIKINYNVITIIKDYDFLEKIIIIDTFNSELKLENIPKLKKLELPNNFNSNLVLINLESLEKLEILQNFNSELTLNNLPLFNEIILKIKKKYGQTRIDKIYLDDLVIPRSFTPSKLYLNTLPKLNKLSLLYFNNELDLNNLINLIELYLPSTFNSVLKLNNLPKLSIFNIQNKMNEYIISSKCCPNLNKILHVEDSDEEIELDADALDFLNSLEDFD